MDDRPVIEEPVIVDRPVVVNRSNPIGPAAIAGIVITVAIVALFIWKPWAPASTTVIEQPAAAASDSGASAAPTSTP